MAASVIADSGFLVALLSSNDRHHEWASGRGHEFPPPWHTCEAVLVEAFYLLGKNGAGALIELLRSADTDVSFNLDREQEPVLALMEKYADLPMSFADACLVRMTETHPEPVVLTTDADFRIYRRHSRQVVPCVMPD